MTAIWTAHIQAEKLGVNLLIKTPIKVNIAKYTASPKVKVFPAYMSSPEGQKIQRSKLEIESAVNSITDSEKKITSEQAKKIIDDIYCKEEREAAAIEEEAR